METKYDTIGKFEIAVGAMELVKIHVGKARMTKVKNQKRNIENYLKRVDSSNAGSRRETLDVLT